MFRCFYYRTIKLLCSKHMTVQNLQMNRCLDVSTKIKMIRCLNVFTTDQVRCLVKANNCSKPPDEQMFRCFTKDQDDQMFGCFHTDQVRCLVKAHDCSKPPDEQMFRCFHHRASKMFCS